MVFEETASRINPASQATSTRRSALISKAPAQSNTSPPSAQTRRVSKRSTLFVKDKMIVSIWLSENYT